MPTDGVKDATSSPSPTSGTPSQVPARPDERFPKSRRLLKRPEFQRVYDAGLKAPGPCFILFYAPRQDSGPGRAGLTVSRKVGKSVVRSRVKRLLREAIRRSWEVFPDGLDAVFHARRGMIEASFDDIVAEVRRTLAKAGRRVASGATRRPLH